jgi:hypothetical protein
MAIISWPETTTMAPNTARSTGIARTAESDAQQFSMKRLQSAIQSAQALLTTAAVKST